MLNLIRQSLEQKLAIKAPKRASVFLTRFDTYAEDVNTLLKPIYGQRADYQTQLSEIFHAALDAYLARDGELSQLDRQREKNATWYQHHAMLGMMLYVDQYAKTLEGLQAKIPYFEELGLTYLHLMPLYRMPNGPNDGGYAVSSYREVDPELGTMKDLIALAADLRKASISLVMDFVFNHTANDHEWAQKARAGDQRYQDYYFMFDDRDIPDKYDVHLREIFPEDHTGSFTYYPDVKKWVWTTFHTYQFDLNYRNPEVFQAMLREMLFLANVGVEVLRLDAVPFIWKEMGTNCENLPQAHRIIRAYNALIRIATPGMLFKSEAIVHPDDVVSYLGTGEWSGREAEIGYNPILMVHLWEALATRETKLLTYSMQFRHANIPDNCAWITYVRSHDDIGWGFANEDAEALWINPFDHRMFLNNFYTGKFEGSFATGYPFQFNPQNMDMRINGTTASLCGLEKALQADDEDAIELAIRRIVLIYAVVFSMGGIPLIYYGDEIGTINDYSYRDSSERAEDSRWVHRPRIDWEKVERRKVKGTLENDVYSRLMRLISVRKQHQTFNSNSSLYILGTPTHHTYAFTKSYGGERLLMVGNFSEHGQTIWPGKLPLQHDGEYQDEYAGRIIQGNEPFTLDSYEFLWILIDKTD